MKKFQTDGEKQKNEKKVKKGNWEYVVIPMGAKDTGLSGQYWTDLDNIGPRRRRNITSPPPAPVR